MAFDTSIRDLAVRSERAVREEKREQCLSATLDALNALGSGLGMRSAYLFGSLVREGAFRQDSDVDIAVEGAVEPIHAAARLSARIGREVQIVVLDGSPVARRALAAGTKWIPAT